MTGRMTRPPAFDRHAAAAYAQGVTVSEATAGRHGREILRALAVRGLRVRLGSDGAPRVGPRHLVDDATVELLRGHRAEVVAALRERQR